MQTDFIDRVRAGVAELARLDPKRGLFGAASHGYRFATPVAEPDIAVMEARWSFRAPVAYRTFMLEVSNGGPGPHYGVFPFGMVDSLRQLVSWASWQLRPGEPFPHRAAWNDTSAFDDEPEEDEFADEEAFEEAHEQWYDRAEERYAEGVGVHLGCLPICDRGCALRDWLVVTGPEAGHVWHDSSADQGGIAPVTLPGQDRVTFDEWYLAWLDRSLQLLRSR